MLPSAAQQDAPNASSPSVAAIAKDQDDSAVPTTEKDRSNSSTSGSETLRRSEPTWTTTFLRFGPLAGIFGIILALASILASLAILVSSNQSPVAYWKVQPSTLLAIFTAVANQSMRFAAWQGVAIAWWSRASRKGSTIGQLHRDWRSGTTIRGAIMAGRHFSWLGLACIFSTIVAIDGPLLQRASKVVPAPVASASITLQAEISPEIPSQFTGIWGREPPNVTVSPLWNTSIPTSYGNAPNDIAAVAFHRNLLDTIAPWLNSSAMSGFIRGCPDECQAKVLAPALAKTSCASHKVPVNYSQNYPLPYGARQPMYPLNSMVFLVDIALLIAENESIDLVTGYSQTNDCEGTFHYTACTLQSAIGLYDVRISNGIVSLISADPPIVALANNTGVNNTFSAELGGIPSTLAGIVEGAYEYWAVTGAIVQVNGKPSEVFYGGLAGTLFIEPTEERCFNYRDPQSDVLESMNQLMFRTGVLAASLNDSNLQPYIDPGLSFSNTVDGQVIGSHNVYVTTFRWFVAAAIVEIVCVALVMPTYYGWWQLGRAVSLSPLETVRKAKAFEAPLLDLANSNSSGAEIAKTVGNVPIQYGAKYSSGGIKLALGNPEATTTPQSGARVEI